jgi:uncharacterized protein
VKAFFDSSSFAKRYIEEAGSGAVDDLCMGASELGLSVICAPEILSALNRRLREGSISSDDYAEAKRSLAADVRDAVIVNLTAAVISTCVSVLESNPVRAMDALHIACGVQWKAELFVSSDARQAAAAENAGLCVKRV